MVRLRDSWPFSLSSAPTVGNPCRPLQPESVSRESRHGSSDTNVAHFARVLVSVLQHLDRGPRRCQSQAQVDNLTGGPVAVFGYARVSTARQANEGESLD